MVLHDGCLRFSNMYVLEKLQPSVATCSFILLAKQRISEKAYKKAKECIGRGELSWTLQTAVTSDMKWYMDSSVGVLGVVL